MVWAGLCAVGLLLGACSTPAPNRTDVTKALVASGYKPAEARCLAEAYERVLTDDELRDVAERGGGGVPTTKATRLSTALAACATGEQPSTTTVPATPSTTAPGFSTSTPSTRASTPSSLSSTGATAP